MELIGSARTVDEGKALESPSPQLVILDPSSNARFHVEVVEAAHAAWPKAAILVFTALAESVCAMACFRAGAKGFLTAGLETDELGVAIRKVLEGARYISSGLAEMLLDKALEGKNGGGNGASTLTKQEIVVMKALGRGLSTREIARELRLSEKTIETHRRNLKSKLGLKKSAELVDAAMRFAQEA